MKNPFRFISKGAQILSRRLREQGLRTTVIWAYGRGYSKLTGVPTLRFSQITPQLYVGPQYGERGKRYLEKLGIAYDVNLRIEFDDAEHGLALAHYCHLPTVDDAAPSIEDLHKGVAFIREAIRQNGKVYIHCAGGVGRAPTMAAAYLITTGLTLEDALTRIRLARPFIYITPPQMAQLRRFESELFSVGQSDALA